MPHAPSQAAPRQMTGSHHRHTILRGDTSPQHSARLRAAAKRHCCPHARLHHRARMERTSVVGGHHGGMRTSRERAHGHSNGPLPRREACHAPIWLARSRTTRTITRSLANSLPPSLPRPLTPTHSLNHSRARTRRLVHVVRAPLAVEHLSPHAHVRARPRALPRRAIDVVRHPIRLVHHLAQQAQRWSRLHPGRGHGERAALTCTQTDAAASTDPACHPAAVAIDLRVPSPPGARNCTRNCTYTGQLQEEKLTLVHQHSQAHTQTMTRMHHHPQAQK